MCAIKYKTFFFGLVVIPCAVLAQPSMLAEQQQFVRDLIQQENQGLNQTVETRQVLAQPSQVPPTYAGADLILKAMYGVDTRILAEVLFRGKPYLYLRGQTWPIGDSQGRSQLRLLSMSSRCIRLAHKEEQFDACVLPQGGQF